jgi:hypothetical protein
VGGGDQVLELSAEIRKEKKSSAHIKVGEATWFEYSTDKATGKVAWSSALFNLGESPRFWYATQSDVWRLLKRLPSTHFEVSVDEQAPYIIDRVGDDFKVQDIKFNAELPRMGVIYSIDKDVVTEWSSRFDSIPLDNLFKTVGDEFFLVPGHAYSGFLQKKELGTLNAKLAWKGSVLALLSKSSCKALVIEKPELAAILKENFTHQVEMSLRPPNYQIVKWSAKAPGEEWTVSGEWSNSPIKCVLKLQQKALKRKPVSFEISLN